MATRKNTETCQSDGECITHPDYATAAQIARRLQLKTPTITKWARDGKIPALRMGQKSWRFQFAAVVEALQDK